MKEDLRNLQKELYRIERKLTDYIDQDINETNGAQQRKLTTIINIVARYHEMTPMKMKSRTRRQPIMTARQRCHYFARKYTQLSYDQIGLRVGMVDHTTVLLGIRKVNDFMTYEPPYKKQIDELDTIINDNL